MINNINNINNIDNIDNNNGAELTAPLLILG